MPTHSFAVFRDDPRGPLWIEEYEDYEKAKATARQLADEHKVEFFVFDLNCQTEVIRFKPAPRKPKCDHPATQNSAAS